VPRLLQGFGERHPLVTLNFIEGTQDELQEKLATGELDLVVLYDMAVAPNPARITLFSPRPYVIVHPEHRLASAGTVDLGELIDEPFILMDAPPSSQNTLSIFAAQGLKPLVRHRTFSYELTRALVGRGLGYSILVQRPHGDKTYEGNRITLLEIDPPARPVDVILTWMQDARLSPAAAAMVTFARDEFAHPEASL
jgi:DNA-binding transcriptional LysR family regulator